MLWHDPSEEPTYSQVLELDLSTVVPSLAGPRRPQDRVPLSHAKTAFLDSLGTFGIENRPHERQRGQGARRHVPRQRPDDGAGSRRRRRAGARRRRRSPWPSPAGSRVRVDGTDYELEHGSVVIAAITSCTNTSNPQVMVGAGLLAKKAVERGLTQQAVGEDEPRARLEGRDRVLRQGRADAVPRAARLPHGRLRLHDLHRQLRAAARGDLGRGRGGRPRRLLGALGQPQLRGPHPPGGEGELPRLAAARRRLRARGPDGPRPARGAARRGPGRQRRLPARPLAERGRDPGDDHGVRPRRDVPVHLRRRLQGRRAVAQPARPRGRALRVGAGLDVRPPAALLRRHAADARSRSRTSTARAASSCSATRSRPTTSPRPARSGPTRPRASTWSSTASSGRTSTPTARAAATTR